MGSASCRLRLRAWPAFSGAAYLRRTGTSPAPNLYHHAQGRLRDRIATLLLAARRPLLPHPASMLWENTSLSDFTPVGKPQHAAFSTKRHGMVDLIYLFVPVCLWEGRALRQGAGGGWAGTGQASATCLLLPPSLPGEDISRTHHGSMAFMADNLEHVTSLLGFALSQTLLCLEEDFAFPPHVYANTSAELFAKKNSFDMVWDTLPACYLPPCLLLGFYKTQKEEHTTSLDGGGGACLLQA